jgi:hypothetical protein
MWSRYLDWTWRGSPRGSIGLPGSGDRPVAGSAAGRRPVRPDLRGERRHPQLGGALAAAGARASDRYQQDSGRDLSGLGFYIALACFKLAVILEGIYYRHLHGQTVGVGYEHVGALAEPLAEAGLTALKERI